MTSNMQWFSYEVEVKLKRKRQVRNVLRSMLIHFLTKISEKVKGEGQVIRAKVFYSSPPNKATASLTPDFKLDVHAYPEKLEMKNGKFTFSFAAVKVNDYEITAALRESLAIISQKFNLNQI